MARMVAIKNMIESQISVRDMSIGINRRWQRRGQVIPLPYETVEQLLWQDGFRRMIDQGILYIESLKDKQDLGLEPINTDKPVNIIALTEPEIKSLLTEVPVTVFRKRLSQLPDIQIDNIIDYAIANKIINLEKIQILKEITNRDILEGISKKSELEAEEKKELQKRASR